MGIMKMGCIDCQEIRSRQNNAGGRFTVDYTKQALSLKILQDKEIHNRIKKYLDEKSYKQFKNICRPVHLFFESVPKTVKIGRSLDMNSIKVIRRIKNVQKYYFDKDNIFLDFFKRIDTNSLNEIEIKCDDKLDYFFLTFLNKLKILRLSNNLVGINGIEILKNLEQLYLYFNKINNIDVLEKCNYGNIMKIDFSFNEIINIDVFGKVNFQKLKILDLGSNQIDNIKILSKCNFPELSVINFSYNKINDISVLASCKFIELNELILAGNKIDSIECFSKCNFSKLNKLDLNFNEISDISALEKSNFPKLNELNLGWNKINSVKSLAECKFSEIMKIDIRGNLLRNIEGLESANFPELTKLWLKFNNINDLEKILKDLQKNKFRKLIA